MSDSSPLHLFVPTFRIDETLEQIRECLEKGWTGLGFKTVQFEEAWNNYTHLKHSHFLASATAGLHLALKILREKYNWLDGDEIITTPLTFVSTNHAILYENFQPVFADVDEYLCLDVDSVAAKITPRTRAVMFVGLGGNVGRLKAIAQICKDRGLSLILDAAHMAGTKWQSGEHVGAETEATVFSFQAVKNLPTADSGMICFADAALDAKVRKLSWLGISRDTYSRTHDSAAYKWHYDVNDVGFKYHGNSIMASMGLVALKYLDQDNQYRRQLAQRYDELLAGVSQITRIPMSAECVPSRHLYQIMVQDRDQVLVKLNERGIYPGVHYATNTKYPMYRHGHDSCPKATKASSELISLPLHLRLTPNDVERIAMSLKEIVRTQG